MVGTDEILRRGYFPKELPPPFTSVPLAQNFATMKSTATQESLCLKYSYSKYASVRRTLAIPNPAHMGRLAQAISTNWPSILQHCSKSQISRTKPMRGVDRAITGEHDLDELPSARADIRTGARYVVRADVANFYGSVYTHAIPWALHTKAVAKANRRTTPSKTGAAPLIGNLIDEASRNIQSGQTIGLPIGPDTSFAIAEAVLCEVDSFVASRLRRSFPALRFVDDYEFACSTLSEAEHIRSVLQDSLAYFELQLNPRKTRIIELPDVLDTVWVHELASFALDSPKAEVQRSQLLRYFSRAFELVRNNPGEPVLKYAVRRIAEADFQAVAKLSQDLLFQAATVDPGTLQTALYVTHTQQQKGAAVDQSTLKRALSAIIVQHAPLQHGGDVAWALWGGIVFGVQFDEAVVSALELMSDPVAVLVALHAEQEGLLARRLNRAPWELLLVPNELFDSSWLLVYDGAGKGWLGSRSNDPAMADAFFADARSRLLSFYDENVKKVIPAPSAAGEYG